MGLLTSEVPSPVINNLNDVNMGIRAAQVVLLHIYWFSEMLQYLFLSFLDQSRVEKSGLLYTNYFIDHFLVNFLMFDGGVMPSDWY